jgi:dipeptidyl aminopeptidase/acylaminoacyl peptidase
MTASPARRSITNDDLFAFKVIGDFHVSPDGTRVVFALSRTDVEKDRTVSNLWLVETAGGAPRQLTSAYASDTAPRWSPDGTQIAFISDREERKELWIIAPDGGEARRLTRGESDVSQHAWSPDGKRLAYVAKSDRPANDDPTHTVKEGSDVRVYTQLGYKADGEGFWDGQYKHLFAVAVDGGEPTQLTDGLWNDTEPVWSPDGTQVAFVSRRTPDREWTTVADIFVIPADGGTPTQLTQSDGPYRTPVWSPDGRQIAFIGHNNPPETGPSTNDWVWTIAATGGAATPLTRDFDRGVGDGVMGDVVGTPGIPAIQWAGSDLYFHVGDHGTAYVARVPAAGGDVTTVLGGDRNLMGFQVAEDRIVALTASMTLPCDLVVANRDGADERRITQVNDDLLAEIDLSAPERIWVPVDAGVEMDGWILHPPGFDPLKQYPLILEVHGGPRGQYGNAFMHSFHRYAAEGYVVAYFNPRGSTGYGQAFTTRLTGDWGVVDMHDLMAGMDYVLERRSYVSENRVGITGGSYGGYATNYLIGAYPDRWQVAVTERSTFSRISHYGTGDMAWRTNDYEFNGPYWENRDFYWDRSPIAHVQKITVPLLIINSEDDHRCQISEGEQLFTALRRMGRDVVFVRFPNESHGLSRSGKPAHRRERLERIVAWFQKYMPAG